MNFGKILRGDLKVSKPSKTRFVGSNKELINLIKPGTKVTILIYNGLGKNGPEYKEKTGRAIMPCSQGGWVLNMGGKYGTPGIADETNIISVGSMKCSRTKN